MWPSMSAQTPSALHCVLFQHVSLEQCSAVENVCCSVVQVLISATEAAEMILRVDDIIKCAPRQRN